LTSDDDAPPARSQPVHAHAGNACDAQQGSNCHIEGVTFPTSSADGASMTMARSGYLSRRVRHEKWRRIRFQLPMKKAACKGRLSQARWITLLLSPEILETVRRKLGVLHCVLDVLVPKVGLQRSGIVTVVRQLVAASMS